MKRRYLQEFGQRLKELRKQKNLTQAMLAEKIGFSTNFIGMVERGERNTTVENIFVIAEALDIKLSEFFKNM